MKAVTSYKTLAAPAEGFYKEKGSKFLAFAYPVNDQQAIEQRLQQLRKQYHDARHHCYAWVLQPDGSLYRANDDGEPSHSAGDPILGQIRSLELTYSLVVVVRYFGGTKLGVSGLIRAYKTAAADALGNARIITRQVTQRITLTYDYPNTNQVMKLIDTCHLQIIDQQFDNVCHLTAELPLANRPVFEQKVALLQQTGCQLDLKID
ncbi:MAG TPA: YigZ family protein [Flammeovirgaceae bacterium]|nr:YigZ family protein [Flammeovirgaceae bacterium]